MVEMKMCHDDGIDIKEAVDRARQVAVRISAAGARSLGHIRIGALVGKHRVYQKALASEMHDACGAANLLKFHGMSSEIG